MWADLEVFTLKFSVAPARNAGAAENVTEARGGRFAVLVGNLKYEKGPGGAPAPAPNAADLDLLESALRQDGFEVLRKADVNLEDLRQIERTLGDKLQAGDTALIYYTGYDVRSGGDDWLLPANYDPGDPRPLPSKAYSTLRLMQVLEDSKAGLKFIFLDGAAAAGQPRDNPGAVMAEVDDSTALVYASPPGAAPKAGNPAAAVFALALAEVLGKPGLDARTALQIELPKAVTRLAPSNASPVAILGGGADFVFRAAAAGRGAKKP
jgi:hypothetical protein